MTVSSTSNRKSYAGDGVTASFATSPVIFFNSSELVVYDVVTATGVVTATLTENTNYTVTGGSGVTGTVNLAAGSSPYGAPAAGHTLLIVRTLPLTQLSDLVNNDNSDAEVVEDAFDKLTLIVQQEDTRIGRSIGIPDSDVAGTTTTLPVAGSRASQYLFFGTDGSVGVTPGAGTAVPISAFAAAVVDDADADSFVQTLVAAISAETAPATNDVVLLGDTSEGKGNKMTLANLWTVINSFTTDNLPIGSTDFVTSYDTSASSAKKILIDELPMPRMSISGLTYANNATDSIDVTAGSCRDATDATNMRRTATITKNVTTAWAVGSVAGGLDTGAVGNNDYYIWLIKRSDTGVVDALFSLSSTAPTMPTNYDYKRLIGWFKRVGGSNVAFHTYETEAGGVEHTWDSPTLDINLTNTLTTARRTDAVKVPLNFSTIAHLNVIITDAATTNTWIYCPDQTDLAPSATVAPLANVFQGAGAATNVQLRVRTSAAGLIAARATTATVDQYSAATMGFTWARRN